MTDCCVVIGNPVAQSELPPSPASFTLVRSERIGALDYVVSASIRRARLWVK